MLLKAGSDPNIQNRYGWTQLFNCVRIQDIDSIALLLKYGANPHLEEYVDGMECFTVVHVKGFQEVEKMLVDADKERALKERAAQKEAAGGSFSKCSMCGKKGTLCVGCYHLHYCSDTCQRKDWKN